MNNYAKKSRSKLKPTLIIFKKKSIARAAITSGIFFVFICLASNPELIATRVDRVLNVLYYSLIPATFPFIVLSTLMIKSGMASYLGRFCPFLTKLLNISKSAVSIFIIGLIAGFPIAGVCAKQLYDSGKAGKDECERIIAISNICSPSFVISVFGKGLMNDLRAGVILYTVSCAFSLLYGIALGIFEKTKNREGIKNKSESSLPPDLNGQRENSIVDIICDCVGNAGTSCIRIYSFVIFFSLITTVISEIIPLENTLSCIISGFFEIASGISMLHGLSSKAAFLIGSCVITFSGLSVILQIKSAAGQALSIKKYVLGRFLALLFCPAISYFLFFYLICV